MSICRICGRWWTASGDILHLRIVWKVEYHQLLEGIELSGSLSQAVRGLPGPIPRYSDFTDLLLPAAGFNTLDDKNMFTSQSVLTSVTT